jgi:DNA mismatch repair protein MutS
MAGVPHHAAANYIQRLLDQNFTIAICEQMADPSTCKGIVPREVVRVVSPGIVYDDSALPARENLFVAAIVAASGRFGVAALDVTTGELLACAVADGPVALAELVRLDPRELLETEGATAVGDAFRAARPKVARTAPREAPSGEEADRLLAAHFPEPTASVVDSLARRAAAFVLAYGLASEPHGTLPLAKLTGYAPETSLVLDEATLRHLEIARTFDGGTEGSLIAQVDATKTGPGARLLRRRLLAPLVDVGAIRRRHDEVQFFAENPSIRTEVRTLLGHTQDLERLVGRVLQRRAGPRDVGALRGTVVALGPIADVLGTSKDLLQGASIARQLLALPGPGADFRCVELARLLDEALQDTLTVKLEGEGNVFRAGYDRDHDEATDLRRHGQERMLALETELRDAHDIPSLKVKYTRVFGWYVEVTKTHVGKVPAAWRRKQTVAGGERYSNEALDALADKLAAAEEALVRREAELFETLCAQISSQAPVLRAVAEALAALDVAAGLAEIAERFDYRRPTVDDGHALQIVDGRHPVVERLAAAGRFVANDTSLDATAEPASTVRAAPAPLARLQLVSGPNMAGKSTYLRQTALLVVLAQAGSFVPAKSAHIGVIDRVLTRVGASDNLARGESTFMVEMKETANVLRSATRKSLVILDEIGRGTSTWDGLAIAWAVAEYLHDTVQCRGLFATHYHELAALAEGRPTCGLVSVSAREFEGDLVFLHKLQAGAASRSFGVSCARLAGMPEPVLARARTVLDELEGGSFGASPRKGKPTPQLALFAPSKPSPVLETLKNVDIDRLTPLEALTFLAQLKALL